MHQKYSYDVNDNYRKKRKYKVEIPLKNQLDKEALQKLENYIEKVYQRGIDDGMLIDYIWAQVSLFKMWYEYDLLDFESLMDKIDDNMKHFNSNSKSLDHWNKKYVDYILRKKEKEEKQNKKKGG